MGTQFNKGEWVCINCGKVMGHVVGGELVPDGVPSNNLKTAGPNLAVTCDACGAVKIFFTSDNVVRAIYQLIDAIATEASKAMVSQIGKFIHTGETPGKR